MELRRVKIENFRSCQSMDIELGSYNPIVGYNNAGKSNALRAISWLLRRFALPDAYFGNVTTPVVVEGTIHGVNDALGLLPVNQRQQVAPYIINDTLTFRRKQIMPATTVASVKTEVLDENGIWANNPTGLDNAIGVLFPDPVYIRAMDDAGDDIAKFGAKNTLGLLLKYAIESAKNNNPAAMATITTAIANLTANLNGPSRLSELNQLEAQATTDIQSFFSGLGIVIEIPPPALEEIVKSAVVKLTDGNGTPRNFSEFGHGTQRAVQMALIQLLARYASTGQAQGTSTVILIDEPELYLHPQAIDLVREALKTLAAGEFQIFFTTHSPMMVSAEDAIDTTVFWKCPTNGTQSRQRASTALAQLDFAQHHVETLFSLGHSSQWLFAERPVIVEGKTERFLLPEIYRLSMGKSFSAAKLALIESSGSGGSFQLALLLRNLGYTPRLIFDLDYAFKLAHQQGYIAANDPNIANCKGWLAANSAANNFSLDASGLPMKGGAVNPEGAYELMANAMPNECLALHQSLLNHHIWLWTKGAFEAHLGIPKNNNSAKADFISLARLNSNIAHASDPATLQALLNWL